MENKLIWAGILVAGALASSKAVAALAGRSAGQFTPIIIGAAGVSAAAVLSKKWGA